MMRKLPAWLVLLVTFTTQALADERILDYQSRLEVLPNADLIVTETITVRAEGRDIKRGIYRDFPTDYKDRLGNRYVVDFKVLEVQRDGRSEGFHTERKQNGTRIYVGRKSVTLPSGNYTYTLKYRTKYQLGFFDEHDELYFNAIGTGWTFPIDEASVEVILPDAIPSQGITAEGFTGKQGSKEQAIHVVSIEDGRVHMKVTRPLNRNQGVTVVVTWPKGHVREPAAREKLQRTLTNNRPILVAGLGLLVTGGYFLLVWLLVGKDPRKGVIIPELKPPKNISPAAARFIMKMKYDHRCFACALISMAVKGGTALEEMGGTYSVRKTDEAPESYSKGESQLYQDLLGKRKAIELKQKNHGTIGKAVKALKKALAAEYEGSCFRKNVGWLVPGFLATLATAVAACLGSGDPQSLFMGAWLSFWSIGVYLLGRKVWTSWTKPGREFKDNAGALFITLFAVPFFVAEFIVMVMLAKIIPPVAVIILVLVIALNFMFYHLIKQPTHIGRKLMDQLEGFKLYLSVAEQDDLSRMEGPRKTPELFEAYLPYALALDVEQEWSEQFNEILKEAGRSSGEEGYRPLWHHGHARRFDSNVFAGALGGSLAAAVASSSTAPGSSSGSGGGGFSGGGGGGGGGGGW